MKKYGRKPEKSNLNIHSSDCCDVCSNRPWKISKTRTRRDTQDIDMYLNSEEISIPDEAELTAKVVLIDEEEGLFEASANVVDETAIAIDPDEALEKLSHILYSRFRN